MVKNDMLGIGSDFMESNLEAILSEDGSLHVKPAVTHVIDVTWLSDGLVPLIYTDKLQLTATNNTESLQDQNLKMKNIKISINKIANLQLKSNQSMEEAEILQPTIEAKFSKFEFESTEKTILGNLSETNDPVEMKFLIKLTKQDSGNNAETAKSTTTSMISSLIACLIINSYLLIY
ncbi:unnamed protein product [Acanthocheilonema viteae]|uniref:Uncharacterized protein n=1 Tax=Acanthocheilonema viteae TaxID=6277 RepID=A0A498SI93_ACAVI|nr:unnamed protein product [Acanthocheilonema viteae]